MRQQLTKAELQLWLQLRKPGIEGLRFRRQTPIGPYIVDFFCPEKKLIIEVDGGHHSHPAEARHDATRDVWLAEQGYKVIRFWNETVMKDLEGVCTAILEASKDDRSSNEERDAANPPLEGGSKPRSGFGEGAVPSRLVKPARGRPPPEI
jgi:very-short-patch-repair endonuclease